MEVKELRAGGYNFLSFNFIQSFDGYHFENFHPSPSHLHLRVEEPFVLCLITTAVGLQNYYYQHCNVAKYNIHIAEAVIVFIYLKSMIKQHYNEVL